MSEQDEYYYDLGSGQVVRGKARGWTNRMGPYPTAEEAARAMEHAKERNEEWNAENQSWDEER
ncbi:SPOR domain-containing protein [Georgenia alba]|uniref:SPOR domain-containing protein n=1 Tax=Georgenia alba TaxID=2233858 RepID=A0ABW2QAG1_9MICO